LMQLAAVCDSIPFQGLEALARQAEMAVRSFLDQRTEGGLERAKTRIVTLRSRLARSKKLFEAGRLREDNYFDEVRTAEQELLGLLREISTSVGGARAGERHLKAIENPSDAECNNDKSVKSSPGKAIEPRRDVGFYNRTILPRVQQGVHGRFRLLGVDLMTRLT
jgi:hypothetical protein